MAPPPPHPLGDCQIIPGLGRCRSGRSRVGNRIGYRPCYEDIPRAYVARRNTVSHAQWGGGDAWRPQLPTRWVTARYSQALTASVRGGLVSAIVEDTGNRM